MPQNLFRVWHGWGFEKVSKATYLADVDILVMDQERVKYIIEIQDKKAPFGRKSIVAMAKHWVVPIS